VQAPGVWNTEQYDLEQTWVAVLDDDDAWDADHLEKCAAAAAAAATVTMVVSGRGLHSSTYQLNLSRLGQRL
jgi:hypothetical protein